jgi:osmotically-inducible protein OsmY
VDERQATAPQTTASKIGSSPTAAHTDEPEYKSQQIRDVLAQDDRVGELGLEVHIDHGQVSVSGTVTTQQRLAAIDIVVHELMPGAALDNKVTVVSMGPPAVERVL